MPHNKLIEEKVAAFAAFQLGTFENGLHVPITREQQDEWLHTALADLLATRDAQMIEAVDENTSDGYHTFKELYGFRKAYNAALFNEWAKARKYNVHKSRRHADGEECFGGGWFIVMATLPTGQISNHYELSDWELFQCDERERGDVWDGHTPQDVLDRLLALLRPQQQEDEKAEVPVWRKCSKCDKSMDVLHRGTNFCLEHFNEVITAYSQQQEEV